MSRAGGDITRLPDVGSALLSEQILIRHVDGASLPVIQEEFGLSKAAVIEHVHKALKNRIDLRTDEYREVTNRALDQQMEAVKKHFEAAEAMLVDATARGDLIGMDKALQHHLRAIATRTQIIERRSKLNGLDAPVRIDAKVEMTTPADSELQALINEAHQRAEADRQRLSEPQAVT